MATYQSYQVVGNREDLINMIQMLSHTEAPISSRLSSTKATNKLHEWQDDVLDTVALNAQVEGFDFSAPTLTPTNRRNNYTQILAKQIKVSGSQVDAFDHAGASDEYSYQKSKAMKAILRDEEFSLIHGSGNSGDSATGRVMKGIFNQITTNSDTGTATGAATVLTEARFNASLQAIYQAGGGRPNLTVVDPFNKRQISAFTGGPGSTRQIGQEAKTLYNTVDQYHSDFGDETVIPHYLLGSGAPTGAVTKTGSVLQLQTDKWRKAVARPMFEKNLGAIGDSYITALIEELTLEGLAESWNAEMVNLTTS